MSEEKSVKIISAGEYIDYVDINGVLFKTEGRRYMNAYGETSDDMTSWHQPVQVKL